MNCDLLWTVLCIIVTVGLVSVHQAREGEFTVPHQEQPNLNPYSAQDNDEEVRYPTIGQRKPAAHKVHN